MTAPNELFVVEGGNHSLEPTSGHLKTLGLTLDQLEERIVAAIERFLDGAARSSAARPKSAQ
jgi:hypothetical protein